MHPFQNGDQVEVLMKSHPNECIWFPALVLRSAPAAHRKAQIYVEFETLSVAAEEANGSREEDGQHLKRRLREYVEIANVRPAPPKELNSFFKVGDAVEVFCEEKKGWRKAQVLDILENSKYTVSFASTSGGDASDVDVGVERIARDVEQWHLRGLRDWNDGCWVPPAQPERKLSTKSDRNSSGIKLRIKCASFAGLIEGMNVEVNGRDEGSQEVWYPATIVESLGNEKFLVEYRTLRTEDNSQFVVGQVDVVCIRPCPVVIPLDGPFECFAQVDGWHNGGWRVGYVSKVLEGFKYMVYLRTISGEMMFEHHKLRPRQDWVDGSWITASKMSPAEVNTGNKEPKLRIKGHGNTSEQTFSKGMMVEVTNDQHGYAGSWYAATIVGPIGNTKFLVEYLTLRTDDESQLLQEPADGFYIRPCPPQIKKVGSYKMLEQVDAWYNEGWWVGQITRVLCPSRYAIYFWTSNEELEFSQEDLRPHQQWIGGKWTTANRTKSKLLMKSKLGKLSGKNCKVALGAYFGNGTKVEVRSDEKGYRDCWYPATILRAIGNRSYLVEYQTLTADNETELLKDKADAACIRPSPPFFLQTDRLKPLEFVDAWYNEGWWVGQVSKVTEDAKYEVHLRISNEVMEFQHFDLRPHQDWLNQQWTCPIRGRRLITEQA